MAIQNLPEILWDHVPLEDEPQVIWFFHKYVDYAGAAGDRSVFLSALLEDLFDMSPEQPEAADRDFLLLKFREDHRGAIKRVIGERQQSTIHDKTLLLLMARYVQKRGAVLIPQETVTRVKNAIDGLSYLISPGNTLPLDDRYESGIRVYKLQIDDPHSEGQLEKFVALYLPEAGARKAACPAIVFRLDVRSSLELGVYCFGRRELLSRDFYPISTMAKEGGRHHHTYDFGDEEEHGSLVYRSMNAACNPPYPAAKDARSVALCRSPPCNGTIHESSDENAGEFARQAFRSF